MSVSFSWNTATSVPLLNLSREERAFGWPASFSLKRIALLQYPDLDPAEPDNWRVRKSQDVLEQALRQAVLSGSLDATAKANLVEQDSVARGDDGVQRIVQGTRTVETHEIAALALLNWFNEQDITPSEHMRAWFDATGASFAVLWKEKNEKYVHPGKEADRFTERSFLEGYEDVTDKVRGLHRKQGQSPVRREEATPERCAELAGLERFKAADWIALTGIGLGKFGHYRISTEGVRFLNWKKEETEESSLDDQEQMLRDNDVPALSFPCSAEELIAFVDSETADGTRFLLPEAFRKALVKRCHVRGKSLPDITQHAEADDSQTGLERKRPEQRNISAALSRTPDTDGLVAWQAVILDSWPDIAAAHKKKPSTMSVMAWLKKHGPRDVIPELQPNRRSLCWIDRDGIQRSATLKGISNRLSEWRTAGIFPV